MIKGIKKNTYIFFNFDIIFLYNSDVRRLFSNTDYNNNSMHKMNICFLVLCLLKEDSDKVFVFRFSATAFEFEKGESYDLDTI